MPDNEIAYSEDFQEACKKGDYDSAFGLLLQVDINQQDIYGKAPIHDVCEGGHLSILKLLLTQTQLNINIQDMNTRTALHSACSSGTPNIDLIDELLKQRELCYNVQDKFGETAFFQACEKGHVGVINFMLWNVDDLDVSTANFRKQTPLFKLFRYRDKVSSKRLQMQIVDKQGSGSMFDLAIPAVSANDNSQEKIDLRKLVEEISKLILPVLEKSEEINLRGFTDKELYEIFKLFDSNSSLLYKTIIVVGEYADKYEKKLIERRKSCIEYRLIDSDSASALRLFEKSPRAVCSEGQAWRGDFSILELACKQRTINFANAVLNHDAIDWRNWGNEINKTLVAAVESRYIDIAQRLLSQSDLDIVGIFLKLPAQPSYDYHYGYHAEVSYILIRCPCDDQARVAVCFEKYIPCITKVAPLLELLNGIGVGAGKFPGHNKTLTLLRKRTFGNYRETNDSEKIAKAIFKQAKAILVGQENKVSSPEEYSQYQELFDRCIVRKPNAKTKKAQADRLEWLDNEVVKDYLQVQAAPGM